MRNILRAITLAILVTLGALGCEEGAMEEAGEEVDEAAEDAEDAAD